MICRQPMGGANFGEGNVPAYVREDGAILLAHYEPGAINLGYDVDQVQRVDRAGGAAPLPIGWAPDPCVESGHLALGSIVPGIRAVTMECGPSQSEVLNSVSSTTLFSDFGHGVHGIVGDTGDPGWGAIGTVGSAVGGRSNHGICGSFATSVTGGIGYCDGSRGTGTNLYENHLVSYSVSSVDEGTSFFGCGTEGCLGPDCDLAFWLWLEP